MQETIRFGILGLGSSAVYALVAIAIVTVHRGAGVLNFASAAIGMIGVFTAYDLNANRGVPLLVAFIIAVVLSSAIGALFHLLIMRRVAKAPAVIKIIGTLGLLALLMGIAQVVFVPEGQVLSMPPFLPDEKVTLFSGISVGADRLIVFGIAVVITTALVMFHKYTRFGLATSAVAESREVAASVGWSPDKIAAATWALGSGLSAIGLILASSFLSLKPDSLALLVIPGMAAALVGGFQSWWLALAGAVLIGVGQSEAGYHLSNPAWSTVIPLVLVVAVLTLRGVTLPSRGEAAGRLPSVGPGRFGMGAVIGLVIGFSMVTLVNSNGIDAVSLTFEMAIVVLSVVVVTGLAGQLSLAQLSLAGVGGFLLAVFTTQLGMPMWLGMLAAALATVPVGLSMGVPALRVRGPNLAVVTLALATVIDVALLTNESFASVQVDPLPVLNVFGISFDSSLNPENYAFLSFGVFVIVALAITNLRRGRVGRRLIAVRGNERASAALGISVPGTKLYAFGLAAFLAGLAGALIVAQLAYASFGSFTVFGSINSLLQGVIGGLGWVAGAPVGASAADGTVGASLIGFVVPPGNWLNVVTGVVVISVILQAPDGVVPLWARVFGRLDPLRKRRVARDEARTATLLAKPVDDRASREPGVLEIKGVTVRFGAQTALSEVDLTIRPGEVVGLIGPNGAGKSTLIDVITGFQPPAEGSVELDGQPIDGFSAAKRARLGLSRSFQSLELFEDMTVLDNIRTASDHCGPGRYVTDLAWPAESQLSKSAVEVIEQFRLQSLLSSRPSDVDYARRRLVAIARAVAVDASVILLDEPAAGLDRTERGELGEMLRRLATRAGLGILLVEHDVDLVFSVCDRVVALERGTVIASGTPDVVRNDDKVISAYLGVSDDTKNDNVPVEQV